MTEKISNLVLFEAIQRDRGDTDWPYRVTLEQSSNNLLFALIEGSSFDLGNSETLFYQKNPKPEDITRAATELVNKYHLEEIITSNLYYRKSVEFSWKIAFYLEQLEFALYGLSRDEWVICEAKLIEQNSTYRRMVDFFSHPDSAENYPIFKNWEESYDSQQSAPELDLESLLNASNR